MTCYSPISQQQTFRRQILTIACLGLLANARPAFAQDAAPETQAHKHQITGLFMPEREEDLRKVFEKLSEFKLVSIDFSNAEISLEYDSAKVWPGTQPEKQVERLDEMLRNSSRGTFGAKPLRSRPLEELKRIEIPVVGLDCKGCSYAAYLLVFKLPGVECATASFKEGKVTALIDPELTDQSKLEDALKKGGVERSQDPIEAGTSALSGFLTR